jgi:hypothetical protein
MAVIEISIHHSLPVWAAILRYVCHDFLQGLSLSLDLLWICLYDSDILVSKAAVLIWVDIFEQEPGILFLNGRGLSAKRPHSQYMHHDSHRQNYPDTGLGPDKKNILPSLRQSTIRLKVVPLELPQHAAPSNLSRTMGTRAPNASASKENDASNGLPAKCKAVVHPEIMM